MTETEAVDLGRRAAAIWRTIEGRFWRMHRPRYAAEPLSGEGARRHGGRWNAPGQSAFYLSSTHGTAIAETQQNLVEPGTLVPYDVQAVRIVDLTDPAVAAVIDPANARTCEWQRAWRIERQRPPTWDLADALIAAGGQGVLTPSMVGPDANLVLWQWNDGSGTNVAVIDPMATLPRDQSSWS